MAKRNIKRIVSMVLVLIIVSGCFSSCAGAKKQSVGAYMSKGEFFNLFISETGIYPLSHTTEEMEASDNYEIEGQTMVDWLLLSEDDIKKLDSPVTREIVAMSCVREMRFRKTHNIDIKDIKKSSDPQAVMDAVGMGLFELENGYFNAKKKMTYDECIETLNKVEEIEATSHYEVADLNIKYKENVFSADSDEILSFSWDESENILSGTESSEKVSPSFLSSKTKQVAKNISEEPEFATVDISKLYYMNNRSNIFEGAVFVADAVKNPSAFGPTGNVIFNGSFAIRITEITENDSSKPGVVILRGEKCEFSEYIEEMNNGKVCIEQDKTQKISIAPLKDVEIGGFKLSADSDSVTVKWNHTFTAKGDQIYTGKSEWRNAEAKPSVELKATLSDFKVDADKLQDLLFEQKTDWNISLSFNTLFSADCECNGLRYSPANNGNGGLKYSPEKGFTGNLTANLKNSRFTGASAGGSKEIKLAQINIPLGYGFSVDAMIYLVVNFDGSIHFEVSTENSYGMKLMKTNYFDFQAVLIKDTKSTSKLEIKANIDVGIRINPAISFGGQKLIEMSILPKLSITAQAKFVSKKHNVATSYSYTSTDELEEIEKENEFYYCIDGSLVGKIEFTPITEKCAVGKVLGIFDIKFEPKVLAEKQFYQCHYESDNGIVKKCTHDGKEADEEILEYGAGDVIQVDKYKVILNKGQYDKVSLTAMPLSKAQSSDAALYSGYSVESADPSVATGEFDSKNMILIVSGEGSGSTEITLTVKNAKWSKTSYSQQISVTVSDDGTSEVSFYPQENTMQFQPSYSYKI